MSRDEFIQAYFQRLGMTVREKLIPDEELLRKLHLRHVLTIPYENTDYLTGKIKKTDFEIQFHEVILQKRGGMCIDMNPLFGELLSAIGYKVRCFSTRICQRRAADLNYHVILVVEDLAGKNWWCDVANPFTRFCEPVPFMTGEEFSASGSMFRFKKDPLGKYLLMEKKADEWCDFLVIRDSDITAEDRNESKFSAPAKYPENAVCVKEVFSLVTPEGRRTLTGNLYRESFAEKLYQYECPGELAPWAYAQFGLVYEEE